MVNEKRKGWNHWLSKQNQKTCQWWIYIYIYSHEATYIDCSFDGHIIKGDVAGCITTRVDNFCTYVIEVNKDERK